MKSENQHLHRTGHLRIPRYSGCGESKTYLLHPSGLGSLFLDLLLLLNYSVDLDIDLKQVVNWISQELLL